MSIWIYIFITCCFLIVYSYFIYPLVLNLISVINPIKLNLKENYNQPISILISAHNESELIKEKIDSIAKTTFSISKIECLVCSDNSNDNTLEILLDLEKKHKFLKVFNNIQRKGKPKTINELAKRANGEVLIITDANVLFDKNTISELLKPFNNKKVGLVDTNMTHYKLSNTGIAQQESAYINYEKLIKHYEGVSGGCMIGPFGGCFALRKKLYTPIKDNILADDLFICLSIIEKNYYSLNQLQAKVYEKITDSQSVEFFRKIRIATGGIQNMFLFFHLLSPFTFIGFCFFSHKILRWLGPFLLILIYISNIFLFKLNAFFQVTFYIQSIFILIALIEVFLKPKFHRNFAIRLVSYFYQSNIALLIGWINFIKGVNTNVWQPTKRK